jgi:mannose-6-phosphate isomerase-like protein (cupin superfamily)
MRYLRRFADFPVEAGKHQPQFMAHMESCSIIKGGIPAGAVADPLHRHPVDQFYYVLSGTVGVQMGPEKISAGPDTLVRIPAGQAHFAYNDGESEVVQLEIALPTPLPAIKGKLVPIMELCDAPGGPPPDDCVKAATEDAWIAMGDSGLQIQLLANRATGSAHGTVSLTRMGQSQPEPETYRIHPFDEFWFVLDGTLTADIAGRKVIAHQHDLLIIPAGVPYRAWNADPIPERHLTVLTPEPIDLPLAQWSVPVGFTLPA